VGIPQIITDWKFWSFLVAFVALILSQLPPIRILIKKAKIDLEIYSKIFITHKIGNPNLQIHLILRNIGGKRVRVKKIRAVIYRDGNKVMTLPALNYVADQKYNRQVLLTSFDLNPDEQWCYLTCFLNAFNRNEEKKYRESEINLKNEIYRKSLESDEKEIIHVSDEYIEPFYEIFDEKFNWFPGEYEMEVFIETDSDKANVYRKYRFTIFESLTDDLKRHKEGYSTGAGIYWDSPAYLGSWVDVEEKHP